MPLNKRRKIFSIVPTLFTAAFAPRFSFSFLGHLSPSCSSLSLLSSRFLEILLFFFANISTPFFSVPPAFRSVILLPLVTLLAQHWQTGLIIAQVFFKKRITRSMFTASFSLSSCRPSVNIASLSFPRSSSLWLHFLMHSRSERDKALRNDVDLR